MRAAWRRRSAPCGPIQKIQVYSRDPANVKNFCNDMRAMLGIEVVACASGRDAVQNADIMVTATSGNTIVFEADWLEPGMLMMSLAPGEFDEQTVLRSRVYLSAPEQVLGDDPPRKPFNTLVASGRFGPDDVVADLCDVVAGKKPGRIGRRRDHPLRIRGPGLARCRHRPLGLSAGEEPGSRHRDAVRRTLRRAREPARTLAMLAPPVLPAACSAGVMAQAGYPDRPIKLIVPRPAGGVVDVIAREWAGKVTKPLGAAIIENMGGGGGVIGAAAAARAPADGYTLLFGTNSELVISPLARPGAATIPSRASSRSRSSALLPASIVVHPSFPCPISRELVAYTKQNKDRTNYGSAGAGTISNLAGELFKRLADRA